MQRLVMLEAEARAGGTFRMEGLRPCAFLPWGVNHNAGHAWRGREPPLLAPGPAFAAQSPERDFSPHCLLPRHCPSCLSFRFLPLTSLPGPGSLPLSHARQ